MYYSYEPLGMLLPQVVSLAAALGLFYAWPVVAAVAWQFAAAAVAWQAAAAVVMNHLGREY